VELSVGSIVQSLIDASVHHCQSAIMKEINAALHSYVKQA